MEECITTGKLDEIIQALKSFEDDDFVDQYPQFWIIEDGSMQLAAQHYTDRTTRLGLHWDVYESICYDFPRGAWPRDIAAFLEESRESIEGIREGFLSHGYEEDDAQLDQEDISFSVDAHGCCSLDEDFPMTDGGKRCHVDLLRSLKDASFGITEESSPRDWFSVYGQEDFEDIRMADTLEGAISIALESINDGDPIYFDDDSLCVFVDRESTMEYVENLWENTRVD